MVFGETNFIERMADDIFGKQGNEFMDALHGIALDLAGNPSKEEWIKKMYAKLYNNEHYPNIMINPVYGDILFIK